MLDQVDKTAAPVVEGVDLAAFRIPLIVIAVPVLAVNGRGWLARRFLQSWELGVERQAIGHGAKVALTVWIKCAAD
jgi:hypothetical protein